MLRFSLLMLEAADADLVSPTGGPLVALAAKRATSQIPIVFTMSVTAGTAGDAGSRPI
jgi:hypothetical protein